MSNAALFSIPRVTKRAVLSAAVAVAATIGLIHYEDLLARLPVVWHKQFRYIELLPSGGSVPKPQPAAAAQKVAKVVVKAVPETSIKVNQPVERAPSRPIARADTSGATRLQQTRKAGAGPDLALEQPAPPEPTPQPLLPIQAPPVAAPVRQETGPADNSLQVQNMPKLANALDQLDKTLFGAPGLVVAVLVDSSGTVLQAVREQSGGDDVQDAAAMAALKQRKLQLDPPLPPGQKRWEELRFDYSRHPTQDSSVIAP